MLGFAVAAPGNVVGQHREVIRDDQVVFFIGPRATRHAARLEARSAFVINGFFEPVADCSATATRRSASAPIGYASCVFGLRSGR
jgi:hypothetical protein